mmetsp:Transcript_3521/g.5246  ORF Transcript_3521/g.5246 Transcript_3521/m.5246 type:complete len:233 (+) Transcript_3521:774-1472(+)
MKWVRQARTCLFDFYLVKAVFKRLRILDLSSLNWSTGAKRVLLSIADGCFGAFPRALIDICGRRRGEVCAICGVSSASALMLLARLRFNFLESNGPVPTVDRLEPYNVSDAMGLVENRCVLESAGRLFCEIVVFVKPSGELIDAMRLLRGSFFVSSSFTLVAELDFCRRWRDLRFLRFFRTLAATAASSKTMVPLLFLSTTSWGVIGGGRSLESSSTDGFDIAPKRNVCYFI